MIHDDGITSHKIPRYGLQRLWREGVDGVKLAFGGLEGVVGRRMDDSTGSSPSARRMNCNGVRGEPCFDGVETAECGLPLPGLLNRRGEPLGSGVRGGYGGGSKPSSEPRSVAEVIHRSSVAPILGGESGSRRNKSEK